MFSSTAPFGAQFLAAIGPDERGGHSAQPPSPPGGPIGRGRFGRRLVAVSWLLVALMIGALTALAIIG